MAARSNSLGDYSKNHQRIVRVKAPLAGTRWIGSQPSPAQATVGLLERVAAEEREPGVRPVGLSHFGRIADVVKMSSTLTTE